MSTVVGGLTAAIVIHRGLGSTDDSATIEEQSEKILFYYPTHHSLFQQIQRVSLCEGLVDFVERFGVSTEGVEVVHMKDQCYVFLNPEPQIWLILNVTTRVSVTEVNGVVRDDTNPFFLDDVSQKAVLRQIYQTFIAFHSTIHLNLVYRGGVNTNKGSIVSQFKDGYEILERIKALRKQIRKMKEAEKYDSDIGLLDESKRRGDKISVNEIQEELQALVEISPVALLRSKLRDFFQYYIKSVDFSNAHIFENLFGFHYFPASPSVYRAVDTLQYLLMEQFRSKGLRTCCFLYNGHIISTGLPKDETILVYNFLKVKNKLARMQSSRNQPGNKLNSNGSIKDYDPSQEDKKTTIMSRLSRKIISRDGDRIPPAATVMPIKNGSTSEGLNSKQQGTLNENITTLGDESEWKFKMLNFKGMSSKSKSGVSNNLGGFLSKEGWDEWSLLKEGPLEPTKQEPTKNTIMREQILNEIWIPRFFRSSSSSFSKSSNSSKKQITSSNLSEKEFSGGEQNGITEHQRRLVVYSKGYLNIVCVMDERFLLSEESQAESSLSPDKTYSLCYGIEKMLGGGILKDFICLVEQKWQGSQQDLRNHSLAIESSHPNKFVFYNRLNGCFFSSMNPPSFLPSASIETPNLSTITMNWPFSSSNYIRARPNLLSLKALAILDEYMFRFRENHSSIGRGTETAEENGTKRTTFKEFCIKTKSDGWIIGKSSLEKEVFGILDSRKTGTVLDVQEAFSSLLQTHCGNVLIP